MNKYTLTKNDYSFEYTITFSPRRRSIAIGVYKSKRSVEAKAPKGYNVDKIHQFVESKAEWIIGNLQEIDRQNELNPVAEYTNGSKHLLLGNTYTLNVELGHRGNVELIGDIIYLKALRNQSVEKVLKKWYMLKANELIPQIISKDIINFAEKYHKSPKELEYKFVKSYWGMCTQGMIIKLNAELIRAREEHICYIINHELCHLVHRNHSTRFYKLLTEISPNWKVLKKELNELVRLR